MQGLKKAAAVLAMCAALTLGAIADTWADVPEGIRSGTEQLAVACCMDEGLQGAFKAYAPKPVYGKPATARNYASAPAGGASGMTEAQAKEWIAQRESGGDYGAVSPSGKYYGRYQLTKSMLGGDLSPQHQEEVADAYVKGRYGSWVKAQQFWATHFWY